MLASLTSLLTLALVSAAAFGLGRPLVRALAIVERDRLAVRVWSLAIGFLAAGLLLTGAGLLGLLYRELIGPATLAAACWGLYELGWFPTGRRDPLRRATAERQWRFDAADEAWDPPPAWFARIVFVAAAVACACALVSALAPPTAGDALCYHLELPKAFLHGHAVTYSPLRDNATFPLLAEMWFLWGLALDSGVAAQLIHWELGLLFAAAATLLAAPLVGRGWARIAGALVLLVPGVTNQMTAPLNDVALALLVTLSLVAVWQLLVRAADSRWSILAGLAVGGAVSVKYTSFLAAGAIAALFAWRMVRCAERRLELLKAAAVIAVVATSVGGVWYVRAAWHRGNPIYPFFQTAFSATASAPEVGETLPESKAALGRNPLGWAAAPWTVTMQPERFGGRAHQLGPLLLALLPGLFLARRLQGLGTLLAAAGLYWLAWLALRQNVRFLLPIVAPLATAAVWTLIEIGRLASAPRRTVQWLVTGAAAALAIVPVWRCRDEVAVVVGQEQRKEYLYRHEPTYEGAEIFNCLFTPEAHILSQDYRAFYFDAQVTRENIYRRLTGYDQRIGDPRQLSRRLRQAGFSHLLLAETERGPGISYDPTLARLVEAQRRADPAALESLVDYRFADRDGAVRHYQLLRLR